MRNQCRVDTLVVGAGASGLLTAAHLLRQDPQHHVAVVDPRPVREVGIAYSTPDPGHLMNVRSSDLTAYPDDPDHFVRWLTAHDGSCDPGGFVARRTYGAYLRDLLGGSDDEMPVHRHRAQVIALQRESTYVTVVLSDGQRVTAAHVVLALGHGMPSPLRRQGEEATTCHIATRVIDDPWTPDALGQIGPDDTVVLVGTGLTAVDVVITLGRRPRRAPITAVSSRGVWPCRHGEHPMTRQPPAARPGMSLVDTLRAVREALQTAETAGEDWRSVIDGLRPVTVDIWRRWSDDDRRRFVRLLRRQWDRHRHRMAPSIAAFIEEMEADGLLTRLCGQVVSVGPANCSTDDRRVRAELSGAGELIADWVVNCSGPSPRIAQRSDPLVEHLLAQGDARPGWNGWGLDVDCDGRLVGANGEPDPFISVVGPLRVGGEWESIAIPELRRQAEGIATRVLTG